MAYAKIRLAKSEIASRAFAQVVREYRLVGIRENGEVLYMLPELALTILDDMSAPYELLESNLESPKKPAEVR